MSFARKASLLVKDLGGLGIYYPGQAAVARLPRRALLKAAQAGGDAVRLASQAEAAKALEELHLLVGDRPLPRDDAGILRDAYRQMMFNELEVLRYSHLTPRTIDAVCDLEGQEHLEAARSRGKGAIVLIGHFGANQMIMPALGHKGYPMSQLSAPPPVWADILRDTRTTRLWELVLARRWELEQRLPVQHINVFKFLRPAFECLQQNELLGLAFDGGGGKRWTQVQFLARRCNLSVQPIQLARKTGAAILPTFVVREPGALKHRIVVTPALDYQKRKSRADEMHVNMQAFVDVFADWVLRYPEHYMNFLLLRWKVRGTDVAPFFEDYAPAADQMSAEQAQAHLMGSWKETEDKV